MDRPPNILVLLDIQLFLLKTGIRVLLWILHYQNKSFKNLQPFYLPNLTVILLLLKIVIQKNGAVDFASNLASFITIDNNVVLQISAWEEKN